jgi:hypothetical protein
MRIEHTTENSQCLPNHTIRQTNWPLIGHFPLLLLLVNLCWTGAEINAQTVLPHPIDPNISFDRPGVADAPYTVGPRRHQLEIGSSVDLPMFANRVAVPSVLYRFGAHPNLELRLNASYAPPINLLNKQLQDRGCSLGALGLKWPVLREKKWVPACAIIANTFTGFGPGRLSRSNTPGWDVYLATMSNGPMGFSLNTNWGMFHYANDLKCTAVYAVCLSWTNQGNLSLFIENFGFGYQSGGSQKGWDWGITYLIGSKMQVDLSLMNTQDFAGRQSVVIFGLSRNFSGKRYGT